MLRAILKGADLCGSEPARIAQLLVERGYTDRYDYALQMLNEAGLIKSSPQKLIAEHTDGRFLNELKRELKT